MFPRSSIYRIALRTLRRVPHFRQAHHMSVETDRVFLPSRFTGVAMTLLARDLTRKAPAPGVWPARITLDFKNLTFISPAGVVFLHNIIRWMHAKKCEVFFANHTGTSAALKYLKDSGFIDLHVKGDVSLGDACRPTTHPLMEVRHKHSHPWIKLRLVPWLASRAEVNIASLYGLQNTMAELFNNISDHTRYDIGSVFGQHFPSEHSIMVAISDMGIGIPKNIRRVMPELSDDKAIIQAVKEGFTTRSVPTNAGMGLDQLMRSVVSSLRGSVTIYSGKGIVTFTQGADGMMAKAVGNVGFCPGTTIEIRINTRTIPHLADAEEDLVW